MSVMAPKKQRVLENLNPIPAPIAQLPTAATDTPMDQVEEVAADDEEISDRDYLLSRQRASESLVEPVAAAASGAWIQDELDPGEVEQAFSAVGATLTTSAPAFWTDYLETCRRRNDDRRYFERASRHRNHQRVFSTVRAESSVQRY